MLSLSPSTVRQLAAAVDRAISDALDGTLKGWKPSIPRSEPDAVAAVVSVGLPFAGVSWRATLRPLGYQVKVTGVFTHQTPKVSYVGGATPCELADLLVVIDDINGGATDRRALLIQAKIAHHPTISLHGSDLVQLQLLQTWPDFQFIHQPYRTNTRRIGGAGTPGQVGDSADYGLIDLLPTPVAWKQLDPANPMTPAHGVTLGETLANMTVGQAGRTATPGGADDWSDTVDELLRITYCALAGGSFGGPQRGVSTLAFLSSPDDVALAGVSPAGMAFVLGEPPGGGERGDLALRDPGPISVVHLHLIRDREEPASHRG